MEPVSSSDDDSESSSYSSASESLPLRRETSMDRRSSKFSGSRNNFSKDDAVSTEEASSEQSFHVPENFDDLPSEDSCSFSEDVEGSEYSEDDEQINSDLEYHDHEQETEEDQILGDRIYTQRHERGKIHSGSQKEKRKEKALKIAHDRLKLTWKRSAQDQDPQDSDSSSHDHEEENRKKRSKHAPACASSLRPSFYKYVDMNSSGLGVHIGAKRYKASDPRFQSLSGHFNQDVFDKRYSFLEEKLDSEIDRLQKNIAALRQTGKKGRKLRKKLELNPSQLEKDETELHRLLQEKASRRQAQVTRTARQVVKRKLQEDVALGKRKAYHLKRKDRKKLEMEARLDELRKVGGEAAVAKALAKRRKKKMSKHSSLMPKIK